MPEVPATGLSEQYVPWPVSHDHIDGTVYGSVARPFPLHLRECFQSLQEVAAVLGEAAVFPAPVAAAVTEHRGAYLAADEGLELLLGELHDPVAVMPVIGGIASLAGPLSALSNFHQKKYLPFLYNLVKYNV